MNSGQRQNQDQKRKRCRKWRYRDMLSAKIALAKCKAKDHGEQRAYPCPNCKGWHLTSQAHGGGKGAAS